MKRWNVYGTVVGSAYLGSFDAETGEAAVEKAMTKAHIGFCHQCAGMCEDPEVSSAVAENDANYRETVEVSLNEVSWEEKAREAGWTPPRPKKARKGGE